MVTQDESVEVLDAFIAARAHQVAEGLEPAGFFNGEGEPALHGARNAINGLRGAIIIAHELLDPSEHVAVGVTQPEGDAGLRFQVEHVGGPFFLQMQLIADAVQELVGAAEIPQLILPQILLLGQLLEIVDAQFHPRHPDDVLVIAHAADAILDVGFLEENRVAMFGPTAALVFQPGVDVALGVFDRVIGTVALHKTLKQRGRARHQPGFEQGGFVLDVLARFAEDLVDGSGRMAHLEAAIPEDVQNLVGEVRLKRLDDRLLHLGRKQEHDVDVAVRAQFAAPVAAEGD